MTDSSGKQKYLNIGKVSYLGILFLIGYMPFLTVQNLVTEIMRADDFESLGFSLLAVLYLFQMIGALLGASIV